MEVRPNAKLSLFPCDGLAAHPGCNLCVAPITNNKGMYPIHALSIYPEFIKCMNHCKQPQPTKKNPKNTFTPQQKQLNDNKP